MPHITFATFNAFGAFCSMAEGMEEVLRDDDDHAGGDALLRLQQHMPDTVQDTSDGSGWPLTVPVPADVVATAQDVADNCADNAEEGNEDDAPEGTIIIVP